MTAETAMPRFLHRGMAALGRDEGHWLVTHGVEADLRDALATLWWLHGADVRTEVKVPNCGRIDILVESGDHAEIIEIKRKIGSPGEALAAFRQAHSYYAFMDHDRMKGYWRERTGAPDDHPPFPVLHATVTAADYDAVAATAASDAYGTGVDGMEYGEAMHYAVTGCLTYQTRPDLAAVKARAAMLSRVTDFLRVAELDLVQIQEAKALAQLPERAA